MDTLETARLRRHRLAIRGAVFAVWVVGVLLAIRSGWEPGPWWGASGRPWPYPLGEVLKVIANITFISLGLYDLLRPQPEGSLVARTARAAGILLLTLVWIAMRTWTDRPGYAYATGRYVFIVTGLLVLALAGQVITACVRGIRRRRHAA